MSGDLFSQVYATRDDWLVKVGKLQKGQMLTVTNLGNLNVKDAYKALLAQYGPSRYSFLHHENVLFIHLKEAD